MSTMDVEVNTALQVLSEAREWWSRDGAFALGLQKKGMAMLDAATANLPATAYDIAYRANRGKQRESGAVSTS